MRQPDGRAGRPRLRLRLRGRRRGARERLLLEEGEELLQLARLKCNELSCLTLTSSSSSPSLRTGGARRRGRSRADLRMVGSGTGGFERGRGCRD